MTKQQLLEARKHIPPMGFKTKNPRSQTNDLELCEKRNKHFEQMELKRLTKEVYDEWE